MRSFVPYAVAAALILAVALVYALVYRPAEARLEALMEQAQRPRTGDFALVDENLPELGGSAYRAALEALKSDYGRRVKELREQLADQTRSMSRWFSAFGGLPITEAPPWEEFIRTYRFQAQEELPDAIEAHVRRLPEGESVLSLVRPVPLELPDSLEKLLDRKTAGEQPTLDELHEAQRNAQRLFNLQAPLLLHAAAAGGVPLEPPQVTHDWRSDAQPGSRFRREEVVLHLALPSQRLPAVLRSVVGLDGRGPPVRLVGVRSFPRPMPDKLGPEEVPLIEAFVYLEICLWTGEETP